MPISTVFDKMGKLGPLLRRTVAIPDFIQLGYSVRVGFLIKTPKRDQLREVLQSHPNVNTLYRITNGYDYYLEAIFRNHGELEEFEEAIDRLVTSKIKFHTVEILNQEKFMTGECNVC